jgi:hypothetical protein
VRTDLRRRPAPGAGHMKGSRTRRWPLFATLESGDLGSS